jgi:hypothetical protein
MRAETLRLTRWQESCVPGPSRWLVVAVVWILVAAIDHASRHGITENAR